MGEGCVVVKQPRPNLDVSDDRLADVSRVHNEAAACRAYAQVIDDLGLARSRVPAVRAEFEDDNVVVFQCAPVEADAWKLNLMDGDVDPRIARSIGRPLAEVHREAAHDEALRAQFEDNRPFDQLRRDPYHLTTAERHPDIADLIEREVDRITSVDLTLVHGDFSPKNVLFEPLSLGEEPGHWLIDFEVAHGVDPAFDVAFMLNHLYIKSLWNHDIDLAYAESATAFWDSYREAVPRDVEANVVTELAVLMLTRVDGKSPVEYVEEGPVAESLRSTAKTTLESGLRDLSEFQAVANRERDSL